MPHSALFREYLEACDIAGVRKLWAHVAPHLPQPRTDHQALVMMHRARSEARTIPFRKRAYSHQWLLANGLPSGLPNELRPTAEQIDFKFVYGVGIGMKVVRDEEDTTKRDIARLIQRSMGDAVEDAFADGRRDVPFLRQRMAEARARTIRQLGRPQINVKVSYNMPAIASALGGHVR